MSVFVNIEKPCEESWENMRPSSRGRFCEICAKNVLDLTHKSDAEILKILENSNEEVCGRIFLNQLEKPFFPENSRENKTYKKKFNYSKVAAGIALATSLTGMQANTTLVIKPQDTNYSQKQNQENPKKEDEKITDFNFIFSGKLINKDTNKPITDVKITLITLERTFTATSDSQGNFSMMIPEYFIHKKQNLLYFEFKSGNEHHQFYSREQLINSEFNFTNDEESTLVVMAGAISKYEKIPSVLVDGEEISYQDYKTLDSRLFNIFYFNGDIAKTLYSETSKDGLILLYSK